MKNNPIRLIELLTLCLAVVVSLLTTGCDRDEILKLNGSSRESFMQEKTPQRQEGSSRFASSDFPSSDYPQRFLGRLCGFSAASHRRHEKAGRDNKSGSWGSSEGSFCNSRATWKNVSAM